MSVKVRENDERAICTAEVHISVALLKVKVTCDSYVGVVYVRQ